ncbi:hypothetical protein BKA70DRAFT_1222693 [Coprinopsis sp. MPI-PUGE-AT-0042]|nr:hypothetical protein BKA70DRAFT_1222693 [Coprinopsis sp. MPI-PUGE-AT-0042]
MISSGALFPIFELQAISSFHKADALHNWPSISLVGKLSGSSEKNANATEGFSLTTVSVRSERDARRPIIPTELIEVVAENLGKKLISISPENSQWGMLHKTLVNVFFTNRYIAGKCRKFLFHTINLTNKPTGKTIRHFSKYKRGLKNLAWVLSPQNLSCLAALVKKLVLCFVPEANYMMAEDCAYDYLITL